MASNALYPLPSDDLLKPGLSCRASLFALQEQQATCKSPKATLFQMSVSSSIFPANSYSYHKTQLRMASLAVFLHPERHSS